MDKLINKARNSKLLGKLFHTLDYCLQRELRDCETVLDLGCGPSSPLKQCKNIKYSVGVEAFKPYLEKSKEQKIHNEYLDKKLEELNFPEKSFDAVIMLEVLEHLPEKTGQEILKKTEKWAKKKIVISCPNGFVKQAEADNNPWQRHLSGWDKKKMKALGYKTRGLSGPKFLRQECGSDSVDDSLVNSICFRPRYFWFLVASLGQVATYFFPKSAFGLFNIKKIKQ